MEKDHFFFDKDGIYLYSKHGVMNMQETNICKLIPSRTFSRELVTINFVSESHFFPMSFSSFHTYSANLVVKGKGKLHLTDQSLEIGEGDLFFTFPEKKFYVENLEELNYLYITFTGIRANALVERLSLSPGRALFTKRQHLLPLWKEALKNSSENNLDLISEAVLLYTFSEICGSYAEEEREEETNFILEIKRYVDEHFSDPELTLYSLSEKFNYHPKYVSEQFKKTVKYGFREYVNYLRMERAVALLDSGMKSISDVACYSGYRDPLYFSKLFRKQKGISPRQYILEKE